ncbi:MULTISPECIES: OmpW family outer membrane protein [unclassified Caballeronia]|uniref:OmpW family outer membrane protein n=1 Tax=unclassified Caballeronia TaxID=2646786 RepID=UPI00285DD15E|nr:MULTISPECIES: OmpW family outer membrane protein [unclassified Caballeronia]MDR5777268.1 OmpW family outer membrane protein [Caballeronia sp. LZ002]MDR5852706.1 OmpW family outer membrane protein [Caballeronia sp. LZ003]
MRYLLSAILFLISTNALSKLADPTYVLVGGETAIFHARSGPISISESGILHDSPGTGISIKDASAANLTIGHFLTNNISVEAEIGSPYDYAIYGKLEEFANRDLAHGSLIRGTVQAKYFFDIPNTTIRPFLGGGVALQFENGVHLSNDVSDWQPHVVQMNMRTPLAAPLVTAGVSFHFNQHLFGVFSLSASPLQSRISYRHQMGEDTYVVDGHKRVYPARKFYGNAVLPLNPVTASLNIGYRF